MSHRRPVLAALSVAALFALALLPAAAGAQLLPAGPKVTIDGNRATVTLGAGGVSVDLAITFEQVVGLTAANLGISARLVSPAELAGRLPDGALTSLSAGFPLHGHRRAAVVGRPVVLGRRRRRGPHPRPLLHRRLAAAPLQGARRRRLRRRHREHGHGQLPRTLLPAAASRSSSSSPTCAPTPTSWSRSSISSTPPSPAAPAPSRRR